MTLFTETNADDINSPEMTFMASTISPVSKTHSRFHIHKDPWRQALQCSVPSSRTV